MPMMSDKLAEKCQEVMSLLLAQHHPHVKLIISSHNAELVEGMHGLVNQADNLKDTAPEPQANATTCPEAYLSQTLKELHDAVTTGNMPNYHNSPLEAEVLHALGLPQRDPS